MRARARAAALAALAALSAAPARAAEAGWDGVEFPQWARDVRRTEIITLGSLPFVTIWTALGYSLAVYGEFRNPLDRSAGSFTEEDQKRVFAISAGACVALGLADLVFSLVARSSRRREEAVRAEMISAEPIPRPSEDSPAPPPGAEHLIEGVVESAVF